MQFANIILLFISLNSCKSHLNNVCKNFEDYITIDFNSNCWYNPDLFTTPEKITHNHGLEFQNHILMSKDGYYLNVFRIQDKFTTQKKQPILLQHGILSSAMTFLSGGNKSLAFYLARNGYDVWLANERGSIFSSGHEKFNTTDPEFWDFSFHEVAVNDIPVILEYIAEKSGNFTRTIYIGHSMGTTIFFIYASLNPNHTRNYIKGFIALSPVASFQHSLITVEPLIPLTYKILQYLIFFNFNVMFSHPKKLIPKIITFCTFFSKICFIMLEMLFGIDQNETTPENMMMLLSYHPSSITIKSLTHYIQIKLNGRFAQYDYGTKNFEKYNSSRPPEYPLDYISIPAHLFYAANDNVVSEEDIQWVFNQLRIPDKSMNLVPFDRRIKFNHLNFLVAKDIVPYLYQPMDKFIRNLERRL